MTQTSEVLCPKCGSNQLTVNKKGFSGAKAAGGVILTGGIGLLAGTLGSNKVIITCLACGKRFKPGEGRVVTASSSNELKISSTSENRIICSECQTENFINHAYCKNCKKELADSDKRINSETAVSLLACLHCKNLAPKDGKFCPHCGSAITPPKSGCFIATACYGDYNATEVLVLRKYRDEKLLNTFLGEFFVRFYYFISPAIVVLISKSDILKRIIIRYFLSPIVSMLNKDAHLK